MTSKLSINEVGVNQGLAQIKTGEFFTITAIDMDAKKVTLKNANGDEKIVGKATLERWYRELTAEEVVEFGKTVNVINEGKAADDEVQESAQHEEKESNETGTDADAKNGSEKADSEADVIDASTAEVSEETGNRSTGDTDKLSGNDATNDGEGIGNLEEDDGSSQTGGGNDTTDGGVASPVTPSNAGKDKDKAKNGRKESEASKKNAALMKVRQTIIDTILADSDSIQLKRTSGYDVLKEKHNFAEITRGTNRFNVSVMSKCLTEDQINKVKINPASFGWSIDADFTVFDEGDIETAVQLIRQSREYRLAHPVVRRKKESAANKGNK